MHRIKFLSILTTLLIYFGLFEFYHIWIQHTPQSTTELPNKVYLILQKFNVNDNINFNELHLATILYFIFVLISIQAIFYQNYLENFFFKKRITRNKSKKTHSFITRTNGSKRAFKKIKNSNYYKNKKNNSSANETNKQEDKSNIRIGIRIIFNTFLISLIDVVQAFLTFFVLLFGAIQLSTHKVKILWHIGYKKLQHYFTPIERVKQLFIKIFKSKLNRT
jgi:hypothetical protein